MTALFLLNIITGLGAFLITYKLFRFNKAVDSFICLFIFYFAQIIAIELVLGILSILNIVNILLLSLVIFLFVALITEKKPLYLNIGHLQSDSISLLKNKIAIFALSVLVCFSAVKVFVNLMNPPFGWDSLNYHFSFAVEWMKHSNLSMPITVFDDPSPSYYPINASLIFLWFMMPLKSVFIADIAQVLFFILAFISGIGIARKIGLDQENSFFAVILFVLIPNFFKQLQIAYVDIMVTALFLSAVNILLILEKDFSVKNTCLFGLVCGLLLGIKTTALVFLFILIIPFIYLCLRNIKKAYVFILFLLLVYILGCFSYMRNFIETGNPFYPLEFSLFGKNIFKGVMASSVYRAHFKVDDYSWSKLLFHEGLGLQVLLFALAGALFAFIASLIKKEKVSFIKGHVFILPILLYLAWRYVIPLANIRYIYHMLAISIILGFYIAGAFKVPRYIMRIIISLCILVSISELAKRQELVVSIILTLVFFVSWLIVLKLNIKKPRFKAINIGVVILSLAFVVLLILEGWYLKNEFPRYVKMIKYSGFWPDATKAWDWLNTNTNGNNIAYTGRPVPFPLYGSKFKNNVYYISVNKTEPAKLHYFTHSKYEWGYDFQSLHKNLERDNNYRQKADFMAWRKNLKSKNIDYLFVYSLHQTKDVQFPIEDIWANTNPKEFKEVFANETIHIYKVLK